MILYELNDEKLYSGQNKQTGKPVTVKGNLKNCHESKCERPFGVQLIPHTVTDSLSPLTGHRSNTGRNSATKSLSRQNVIARVGFRATT